MQHDWEILLYVNVFGRYKSHTMSYILTNLNPNWIVLLSTLFMHTGEEYSTMYVLSKAEKRRRRESREYVGRWRKNQVTMAVAAKLGETFLLLLDDRQLAVGGVWWRRRRSGSGWDRRSFLVGAILNSANFHESFFATHPSYHNVEGPKIGRPTNVATVPC